MLKIRTILHATDFSPPADNAFQLACSLARDHGAKLVVLHVVSPAVPADFLPPRPRPKSYRQMLRQQLRLVKPSEGEIELKHQLVEGDPATEILRVATELDCDLIVLGTHGRTGLERLVMGSVAEAVVRKAMCPVLTVRTPFFAREFFEEAEKETTTPMEPAKV